MAVGKNAGAHSQQANDFLAPSTPVVSAADVGIARAYNDGAVNLSWSLDPNSPPASSYAVYDSNDNLLTTVVDTNYTVTGLLSNTTYSFYVVASNASGDSAPGYSAPILVTTVPATPAAPTASSPNGQLYDVVSWTAPENGGSAITLYTVLSNESQTLTSTTTSLNFPQSAGESNTYQVKATNVNGDSLYSPASGSAVTFSFTPFSFTPFGFFSFFGFFGFFSFFGFFGFFSFFGFFGFTPFNFAPFGFFGFTPFNFTPKFSFFGFTPFNFSPKFR